MHQACLIAVMMPINIAHHRPENFLKTSWDIFFWYFFVTQFTQLSRLNFIDDKVMSQCQKVSLPVWHQATPALLSQAGSHKHSFLSCLIACSGRKNQCGHHSFSGQNDTSKRCPSQWLYLISMLDILYSCLINILLTMIKGILKFSLLVYGPAFWWFQL